MSLVTHSQSADNSILHFMVPADDQVGRLPSDVFEDVLMFETRSIVARSEAGGHSTQLKWPRASSEESTQILESQTEGVSGGLCHLPH